MTRNVRSARWRMQERITIFRSDVGLPLRIGVHTGPVLLGEVGTKGELFAIGDTVNLASRLQETAPTGEVLISHDTYRHVRGTFDVLPRELIQVKGKTRPIQTPTWCSEQSRTPSAWKPAAWKRWRRTWWRDAELLTLQNIFR